MRKPFLAAALAATASLAACGGAGAPTASRQNANGASNNAQTSIQHGVTPANPGVTSSHGGAAAAKAGGGGAASPASTKPPVETPELDSKIEKAEAKARAAGAGEADRKAAAAAYFERADFLRDQGSPQLYKFALADYRRGLRYDPSASGPRQRMDEIVRIYQSMGRPVPELGNEP
ncbi:MAG TPA: hypothetical protein VF668_14230 [Pyrinomonadaceae bacterium]|jgi:hypothetical protein